ncbi:MAG: 50S ribosomal protein L16 [Bacilli bacterium]|nr:50S ribosomal protein L16 [Bacilli bacterium]
MLFQPKKTKFLKPHKVIYRGKATTCNKIAFGDYALFSCESGSVASKHLEAIRMLLAKEFVRNGRYWFRVFPQMAQTKKADGVRQGSGKGMQDFFYAPVCNGTIVVEISGVSLSKAKAILRQCGYKLPFRTGFLEKKQN